MLPMPVLESAAADLNMAFYPATSKDELKSYISMKVADYKVPDHIVLVDQLPKTASGKIMKFALKEELLKEKSVSLR